MPLCQALVDGGINVLEITLRTEHGLKAIEEVRKAIPDAWVGAGTVTSIAQYRQVEAAGAQFVITPGVTEAILEFGVTSEAPLLPGIATISEMMVGYNLGYREFKFFPAEVAGGIPALKPSAAPSRMSPSAQPAASAETPQPTTCPSVTSRPLVAPG